MGINKKFTWNGFKVLEGDLKDFQKIDYQSLPIYTPPFLKAYRRKGRFKGDRITRTEKKGIQEHLEALLQGKNPTQGLFFIKKISKQVGYGLFAHKNLPRGAVVGLYSGEIQKSSCESQSRYIFSFSELPRWDLDGETVRNQTAFMNHARKGSKERNVRAVEFYSHSSAPYIFFVTTRAVKRGEQLCYDYGDRYWHEGEEKPVSFSKQKIPSHG